MCHLADLDLGGITLSFPRPPPRPPGWDTSRTVGRKPGTALWLGPHYAIKFSHCPTEVGTVFTPVFADNEQRHREVVSLAQGQTARKK